MKPVIFEFDQRAYKILPDMRLALEIEEELGSLAALAQRFSGHEWRLSELVSLIHIFLGHAGKNTDFMVLGQRMIETGLGHYKTSALDMLKEMTA